MKQLNKETIQAATKQKMAEIKKAFKEGVELLSDYEDIYGHIENNYKPHQKVPQSYYAYKQGETHLFNNYNDAKAFSSVVEKNEEVKELNSFISQKNFELFCYATDLLVEHIAEKEQLPLEVMSKIWNKVQGNSHSNFEAFETIKTEIEYVKDLAKHFN